MQLERRAAELDRAALSPIVSSGSTRVRIVQRLEALLGAAVRDEGGAGVLERLAAGDVIVVVVAVDQVFDRLVGDLLDLVDILLAARRPAVGDRVGGDHALLGDDEHRLVVAVAEDVDVVGAVHLAGFDLGPCRRLRLGPGGQGGAKAGENSQAADHGDLLLGLGCGLYKQRIPGGNSPLKPQCAAPNCPGPANQDA